MSSNNFSVNDSENCLKFSKDVADAITIIKPVLDSFGILMSLFVILLIGFTKKYKQFVYRLVVYLMMGNILLALCQMLELIPIKVTKEHISIRNGTGWPEVCAVLGYLDVVICWMGNFVIIWTMLYMLSLSWKLHCLQTSDHSKPQGQLHRTSHVREIVGVLLLTLSPFLFSWIPFVVDMYGLSGIWCWIRIAKNDGCDVDKYHHLSLALMMIMFYGPLVIIIVFGVVCMIIIILLLRRSSKHLHGGIREQYQNGMKEIGIVLVYPIIYCLFCFFMLVHRIYSSAHMNDLSPSYPLWIIHAVADPSLILIPALAFLLHPYVWKNIRSPSNVVSAYTKYSVPPEDDDIDEGITIRPSGGGYGGTGNSILVSKPTEL